MLLCTAAACSGSGDASGTAALPAGQELLAKAAEAMKSVKTVGFTITTEGKPPVQVRSADGELTREGDAKGKIQIEILGALQELEFVLVGDNVHFKGPTGGYQKMTREQLAQVYDPSAILDPDRGVAKLLSSAANPKTEAEEKVGSADAYRIALSLSQEALAPLVPGIQQGSDGQVWVDKAAGRLLKASLPLGQGDASGTVVVTFADYDAPVTITAPTG
ncbi:LppX_LprAFG lipoprotein [Thermopolyspora sp. NPDC052614]|uniref:LppX_LprAFG lipoprotein n=1 Tax=Thermopolyspora sp. NPDC052614 TaxID=3155682 RepID=UPI0034252E40